MSDTEPKQSAPAADAAAKPAASAAKQAAAKKKAAAETPPPPLKAGDSVTARCFIAVDLKSRVQAGENGQVLEVDDPRHAYRIQWESGLETWANGDLLVGVAQAR